MAGTVFISITEENGVWQLTLDVPDVLCSARCKAVTTKRLGEPRLVEQAYEQPDGSAMDLSKDMIGAYHTDHLHPGPFASLMTGRQMITVWSERTDCSIS